MKYGGTGVEESDSDVGGTDDLGDGIIVSNMTYGGAGVEESDSDVGGTDDLGDGIIVSNMTYGGAGVEESDSDVGGTDDLGDGIIVSNMTYGGAGVEESGRNDGEGTDNHRDGVVISNMIYGVSRIMNSILTVRKYGLTNDLQLLSEGTPKTRNPNYTAAKSLLLDLRPCNDVTCVPNDLYLASGERMKGGCYLNHISARFRQNDHLLTNYDHFNDSIAQMYIRIKANLY